MISKPTLLLDEKRCRKNILAMAKKAKRNNCTFRPHFKTHQCLEVGRWFKEYGVEKITVSSISMAFYFSKEWNDITVAFPVNILEIEMINKLASCIKLNLLVTSKEHVVHLKKKLLHPVSVFLKIDTGYRRSGITYFDFPGIDDIIKEIDKSPKIKFSGFLTHAGYSYDSRSQVEIEAYHQESVSRITGLTNRYRAKYPDILCSVGDTPTCSAVEDFSAVDELRPGNFVFYDLTQVAIGSCKWKQIAVAMACPIVAKYPERNEMVVYGGGVHFSKDSLDSKKHGKYFGQVVSGKGMGWDKKVKGAILKKISQEHGTILAPTNIIDQYKIGDLIKILPVHSCMSADLMKSYLTTKGERINFF